MCLGCVIELLQDSDEDGLIDNDWRRLDWPEITESMADGVHLIRYLYCRSGLDCGTGGQLHVLLDDYNCDDHLMEAYAKDLETPYAYYSMEAWAVCKKILEITIALDEKQRMTMISCAHDNIPPLPREYRKVKREA